MATSASFRIGMQRLADRLASPSLLDNTHRSARAVELQGDIVEMIMASMRGYGVCHCLSDALRHALPVRFDKICQLLRALHVLDGRSLQDS